MTNKKGFTLIELLVVVLIIGILAAIALPQYFKAVEKSRATEALSIMGSLAAAMERARLVSTDNTYPADVGSLDIQFTDHSGTVVTAASWKTKNFEIKHDKTNGTVTATRGGQGQSGTSGYTITRNYLSGKVTCTDGGTTGICASLGLPLS